MGQPVAERDSLLVTVNGLQETLQEQCNLRGNCNNRPITIIKYLVIRNTHSLCQGEGISLECFSSAHLSEASYRGVRSTVNK